MRPLCSKRHWLGLLWLPLTLVGCMSHDKLDEISQQQFLIRLDTHQSAPLAGRLLLFAEDARSAERTSHGPVTAVDTNPFMTSPAAVAAREVAWLAQHHSVILDADELAYPSGFSSLPPGEYYVQAVLDVNHDYNYRGRSAGDVVSPVVKLKLPLRDVAELPLDQVLPASDPWQPPGATSQTLAGLIALRPHVQPIAQPSPVLSAFWGRQIRLKAWVLTPPDYAKNQQSYPVVYYTQGFGGDSAHALPVLAQIYAAMLAGTMPPMIWVALDESGPTGTHEFADSVNNGPWGQALTTELIPALEAHYRMDAKPQGRFLNGHSSGGWATLWLQTRYPAMFGGTWSTAPDPSDFHDFTGPDLYAAGANVYTKPDGSAWPLVREHGHVVGTFEQFARQEQVLGAYGGQMASFEWVFSPRGPDGRPLPMFNRYTGAVDPQVVRYWRDHYDIAWRLAQHWPELQPDLDGKLHLYVGTDDTFYLDGAARRLKSVLDKLGAHSDIRFLPGKTHLDLYLQGHDRQALLKQISWDMYAIARPRAPRPRPQP